MSIFQLRFVNIGLSFLLIFSSGYWLHHSGKPYGAVLFNAHKLIGFGLFVLLIIRVSQLYRATPLGTPELIACMIAGLFFLATIVFGGLVSIDKAMPNFVSLAHKLLPWLTALSTMTALFLLLRNR
jgi:hypothetical protein